MFLIAAKGRTEWIERQFISEKENSESSFAIISEESFLADEEVEEQLGDVPTTLEPYLPYQGEPLASSSSGEELPDTDGIPLETQADRRPGSRGGC